MDKSPHQSSFVNLHGLHPESAHAARVRLHYLDWGGNGPALLFLAGLGCNAHIFDQFAPRFTDHFRVLGLTRRAHGESDYPDSGYDIDTLTEDIRGFLDALQIDQVILVGHSLAGVELAHFAAVYPQRVLKLVFLDAGFYQNTPECRALGEQDPLRDFTPPGAGEEYHSISDYVAYLTRTFPSFAEIWGEVMAEQFQYEVTLSPEGKVVDKRAGAISQAFGTLVSTYAPEYAKIMAPVLNIYAIKTDPFLINPAYLSAAQKEQVAAFFHRTVQPYFKFCFEQFKQDVPHARMMELPHSNHYCFIKDEEAVFKAMRDFLLA